jgi:hypothetical protein
MRESRRRLRCRRCVQLSGVNNIHELVRMIFAQLTGREEYFLCISVYCRRSGGPQSESIRNQVVMADEYTFR